MLSFHIRNEHVGEEEDKTHTIDKQRRHCSRDIGETTVQVQEEHPPNARLAEGKTIDIDEVRPTKQGDR